MICLITLDEVLRLRFVSRSVVHIAFDPYIRNNFLDNEYCGWVNRGLDVSCMLKMAEKEGLSALESDLKFRVLCVRNQDTGDRIRHLLVIGHFVGDVEFVEFLPCRLFSFAVTSTDFALRLLLVSFSTGVS